MSLNVKSNVEVNTQNAQASIENLNKKFGAFNSTLEKFGSKYTKDAKNGIDILAHSLQTTAIAFNGIKNTFNAFSGLASSFIKTADAINTMNARLKLTTTSMAHFEALKKSIDGIAKSTYASSDSISNLFIGLNSSLKSLGVSQNEVLKFSETITQAFKVSGASAVDTERALVQLNQAFSMGALRGQEYNSIVSAAPALLDYMADALGVAREKLTDMAKNGGISAQLMIEAFGNMRDSVAKDFAQLPLSVENATQSLTNSFSSLIEQINSDLKITDTLASSIESFSQIIENNKEAISSATQFIKNHGVELVALLAIYKTYPAIVAATKVSFEGLIKVLGTSAEMMIFGADKAYLKAKALGAAKTAAGGLLKVFGLFGPQLLIFGALDLLYNWLNKNKAAAVDLTQTLNITLEQMNKMTSAQLKNTINELGNAKLELAREYNAIASQMLSEQKRLREAADGKGLLKDYDNELITSLQARKDSITKQIDEINAKQKELADTLSKSAEQATKAMTATSSAVDETAKAFKSAMDSSAAFTKNITLLSDYQKEIKAINGEIDKLNELLKDNKLTESQRTSALEQIERLNEARAQTEAKIAKASEQNAKTSINAAKQIAKSYTEALDAQISYFNAIKDHWGAVNVELAKYEADLLDKVKKNLLSREQAEAMMQQKRIELEKSANDKILKNIESTYNEQIEFHKITGDREKQLKAMHEKAHKIADEYIKKHQITAKSAIDNTRKYFIDQEMKSFKSMDESFKDNVSSMTGAWDEMVGGMAKSIEQGLFDFITGKTGSLSGAFKDIGNSILQALISPMASNFSKGVAGIFSSLLGGGGNSVASMATSLGLKLENGVYRGQVGGGSVEILTDGTILSGGAILADKLGFSSGATNILSAASTLKSAASIFTSGVSGLQGSIFSSTFSPFSSVSSALNGFGLNGLGTFVNDFGTGFSNVFSFASNSGSIFSGSSIFAGGMGQALGSMAGGASIGGLVGSLGDMLFGTNTKAGLGGGIGGAIGTAILPGIGTAVGSLLGSVVGGIFGSWEESDRGVQIKELVNYSSGQTLSPFGFGTYVDEEKKSWFGTKERSNFELDSAGSKALNSTMKKLNRLIEDFKTNDLILPAIKITDDFKNGLNMIISTSLVSAIQNQGWLTGQATQNVFAWESAAKAQGKEVLSFMTEQISTMRTYMKALKIDTKDTFNNLKQSVKEYEKNFSTLAKDMGLGWLADINVAFIDGAALADMYSQAIKNSFDPETVANWNALTQSYEAAKQAQDEYTKAIRDFSKNAYSSIISIRGAYGLNTDILSLDSIKAAFYRLNGDIAATADSIDVFSQKLRDMSPAQIGEFLSYDTANRQELISYATQYASIGTTALENMKNAVSNYTKSIANLNEQIATLNEQYESSKNQLKSQIENINKQIAQIELNKRKDELNAQKEHYSALIALYKNQKRFAENLKEIANSLRLDVWGAKQISAYYNSTLAQAKLDYKSANYDSSALKTLSEVSRKQAENLKATAASAEQYRFEVLQMANEIEGIVPKSELESIDESLKNANKMLDDINAAIKELTQKSAQDKDAQIAALEANKLAITHETSLMQEGILKQIDALEKQKQEISEQTAELLRSNAELFGKLGGTFETGFLELVSGFELVATSVDDGFKGLGDELKAITSSASSGLDSTNLSWDALSLQIDGIYQKYFNRNAEWEGLKYWYEGFKNNQASADDILRAGIRNGEYLSSEALLRAQALGISTPAKNSFSPQSIDLNQQIEQGKKSLENQKVQIEHLEASKLSAQSQVEQLDLGLENLAMRLELEQGGLENIIEQTEQGKRQIKLAENSIDNLSYNFELLKNNEQALNSRTNATLYSGFLNMNESFRSGCSQIAGSLSSAINQAYAQGRAAAEAAARASAALAKANNGASNTGVKKFAQGGIVTGPTNALIGEAGYPEAVIPLKDGAGLKIDTSGIFERLENRMLTMEQKLKMVLEKIEKNTNELNRTLSGVTDGDVLYINGKVKVS